MVHSDDGASNWLEPTVMFQYLFAVQCTSPRPHKVQLQWKINGFNLLGHFNGFLISALAYSSSHINSEIFEWQKALFFISLYLVVFVLNGRLQIIEVIEGFILKAPIVYLSVKQLRCPLSGEKSILYVRTYKYKRKYAAHLKSTKSVHLLKLLIAPLPSRNLLSQNSTVGSACVCLFT